MKLNKTLVAALVLGIGLTGCDNMVEDENKKEEAKNQIKKTQISKKVKIANYAYIGFLIIDLLLIVFIIRKLIKIIIK